MKKLKLFLSLFLSVLLAVLPLSSGAAAQNSDIEIDSSYSVWVAPDDLKYCSDAVSFLNKTLDSLYGLNPALSDNKTHCFSFSIEGEPVDYSVTLDRNSGNIVFRGGSAEAIQRAVYTFLADACAGCKADRLTVSDSINYSYDYSEDCIDNSDLLKYKPADKNSLVNSWADGLLKSPQWLDSLIMVEVRPDTASIGGTFPECCELLDYYASVGINAIWVTPIYDKGTHGNGYSNFGPHTVDPRLTGKSDYSEGWQVVRDFVDYAHSKGIYIFLDVITWGVAFDAPLINEHPDWFNGEAWGNIAFDWSNKELCEWFTDTLVNNILVTGADGYRCDCEPNYTGYDIYGSVREKLAEKGKYIAIISEDTSTRKSVYDFEQDGVLDYGAMDRAALYSNPVNFFADGYLDIVDSVKKGVGIGSYNRENKKLKRGTSRYYTNCITNHDYQRRDVSGSRINIGYSAIFAPFIPIWYMGDEFDVTSVNAVLYDIPVNFSERFDVSNTFFFEDVKRMIQIRRTYSEIFEHWTLNHRDSNICEVKVDGFGTLQNYARYADNKAVLIVGNNNAESTAGKVKIPFGKCGINNYKTYTVTDLLTGNVLFSGKKKDVDNFTAVVPYQYVGAYLVEGVDEKPISINLSGLFPTVREIFLKFFIRILSI